ncbi:hypothetical protein [Paenibacillus sp. JDR-2]|uniref:hypothetical protein n=1 Tax=Paenibacillus sp. (strain JDR-2) TaxID=324057 RepID=UPI000166A31E|nr:hypothetical protein [Paenibacillus sp. JDR-2]ACT00236.1 hypothetical protein Pjdr2_1564 [Paenibacillus sp. JDR-2]
MKKLSVLALSLITAAILGGCGGNNNEPAKEAKATVAAESPSMEAATATPEVTQEPSSPQEAKKLSADEQLALDYVNIYLNGTDREAAKKFVSEKIRPDTQSIFALGQDATPSEENMFKNPVVVASEDYETSGLKGKVVLVQSKDDTSKELIVLNMEGKLGFVYAQSDDAETQANFDDMRKLFK